MSYNTIGNIGEPLQAGGRWRPVFYGSINVANAQCLVGQAFSWILSTTYSSVTMPSGWSFVRGPNTTVPVGGASSWSDTINVPAGNWLCEIKIGLSDTYVYSGRMALFDSLGNRLSPVISFRDRNRSALIVARVTGPISVVVLCVQTQVNSNANNSSLQVASFNFIQIP